MNIFNFRRVSIAIHPLRPLNVSTQKWQKFSPHDRTIKSLQKSERSELTMLENYWKYRIWFFSVWTFSNNFCPMKSYLSDILGARFARFDQILSTVERKYQLLSNIVKKWIYFLRVKKEKVASEMCSNKVSSFSIHVRNFRGKGKIWHNNTQQWWSEVEPGPLKRPKERALNRWQGQNSSLKPQTQK